MDRNPTVYLLAKGFRSTLYTGVTSDLPGRIHQHRTQATGGFTARYGIKRLVWFETGGTMKSAIAYEKRIKRWLRERKYALIEKDNPTWRDLAEDFGFEPLPPKEGGPRLRAGVTASGRASRNPTRARRLRHPGPDPGPAFLQRRDVGLTPHPAPFPRVHAYAREG